MGKTIEAGLALKELKLRGEIKRTLLIVPKSAMLQWQSEMSQHFKEQFQIYDSQLIGSLANMFSQIDAEEELNFWRQHNQIIVSTDALKPLEHRQGWSQEKIDNYNKYRIEAVVNADFDLVIIDEAHKMGGSTIKLADTNWQRLLAMQFHECYCCRLHHIEGRVITSDGFFSCSMLMLLLGRNAEH